MHSLALTVVHIYLPGITRPAYAHARMYRTTCSAVVVSYVRLHVAWIRWAYDVGRVCRVLFVSRGRKFGNFSCKSTIYSIFFLQKESKRSVLRNGNPSPPTATGPPRASCSARQIHWHIFVHRWPCKRDKKMTVVRQDSSTGAITVRSICNPTS